MHCRLCSLQWLYNVVNVRVVTIVDAVVWVVVPVQLVDMCQLDLAGNWTTSDPEHTSTVLSKEAKVLGKDKRTWQMCTVRVECAVKCISLDRESDECHPATTWGSGDFLVICLLTNLLDVLCRRESVMTCRDFYFYLRHFADHLGLQFWYWLFLCAKNIVGHLLQKCSKIQTLTITAMDGTR